ncbi:MAG: hypothetical protein ACR2P0_02590 [Acidimicrobiales bacterium]
MADGFDRFDLPVGDDLDVDEALAELGVSEDQLDAALDELERSEPAGLIELWRPPAGLEARIARRANERVTDRQAISAFADLFGLGWRTATAILDGRDDGDEHDG